MHKHYADTELGQIHYLRTGSTNRPPLLLLHDCTSTSQMFRKIMGLLGQDFNVFAPDFPGFGSTDLIVDQASMKSFAHATFSFMKAMRLPPCLVLGHFGGASVAAQLAQSYPERVSKLVLSSPAALTKSESTRFLELIPKPSPVDASGEFLKDYWQMMMSWAAPSLPVPLESQYRDISTCLAGSDIIYEFYTSLFNHNLLDQLKRIEQPTLVVAGRDDIMYPYLEAAFQCLKRGKKLVVLGASYHICETHTEDLATILFEFWRTSATARSDRTGTLEVQT